MVNSTRQWMRKAELTLVSDTEILDLSEMHFRFTVLQSNEESPNTATIRVYNLSRDTVRKITGSSPVEFKLVQLKAGYQDESMYGTIFAGTIRQYRKGRENATDTYLDILASANDVEYNFGMVAQTCPAGTPTEEIVKRTATSMGLEVGYQPPTSGGTLPRGKVLWGMGRVVMRNLANSQKWGWSIQNGKLITVPLNSYLPGEVVVLNAATGMIGIPEQTNQGVNVTCLLNPRLYIGGRMQIDNARINQLLAAGQNPLPIGQIPYDQWAGVVLPADVTSDGIYMMYVVEHSGDTRGHDWYSSIIGLAMSSRDGTVDPYAIPPDP